MKPCFKKTGLCFLLVGIAFCVRGEDSFSYHDAETPILEEKANAGDAEAQYWLGYRFFYGSDDVVMNNSTAARLLSESAQKGNADAQALLGYMYVTGSGLSPDKDTGLEWLYKSVAQTNRLAQYYLGSFYEKGRGCIPVDRFEAMDWYIKAARQDLVHAQQRLDEMRQNSDAVRMGTAEPEWWEIPESELIALAEKGDVESQRYLGLRYKGYGGTSIDFEKAFYWLGMAASQTNMAAHYSLATLYTSVTNGLERKAFDHCLIAAEGGYRDAQYTLGRYYRDGVGVDADREKAFYWYCQAEKNGDSTAASRVYWLIKGRAEAPPRSSEKGGVFCQKFRASKVQLTLLDFDGQEVNVGMAGYDPETKSVKLDRPVGSVDALPLFAFQKKSHPVIQSVARHEAFCDLSLRMKKTSLSKEECEKCGKIYGRKGASTFTYDGFVYDLEFKNRSGVSLDKLEVETRLYYEEEHEVLYAFGDKMDSSRIRDEYCSLKLNHLEGGGTCTLETTPFILESYTTDNDVRYVDAPVTVDANPWGLWVRVSYVAGDGRKVYNDFYEKSRLKSKVEWKEVVPPKDKPGEKKKKV